MVPMNQRLEHELQYGLRPVTAPPELWDRIQAPAAVPLRESNRGLVWAMAATVVLMAVGLSLVHRDNTAFPVFAGDHCQNPAQLRAWVRAKTGLDLPLRADSSPSIQLMGAEVLDGAGVKVAYRVENRDAQLLISSADGAANVPHNRVNGKVSTWVMNGQSLTLASDSAADLQLACKLCHLD
jgi:hypothetical protein